MALCIKGNVFPPGAFPRNVAIVIVGGRPHFCTQSFVKHVERRPSTRAASLHQSFQRLLYKSDGK